MIIGLEGMDAQKHARFQAKHGGQKVFLPVESVMPLPEYTDSLQSAPQKGASKEHQQGEGASGLRRPSGRPREDKELDGVARHLLDGLSTTEVMKQHHEVMIQAAQHKQQEPPPQLAGANNDQYMNPQPWQKVRFKKELEGKDEAYVGHHQEALLKRIQDSAPQEVQNTGRNELRPGTTGMHGEGVKNIGRNELQTEATGMHGQYANVVPGSPRAAGRNELYPNEQQVAGSSQQEEFFDLNLGIGSAVQVKADPSLYGVIRWIGHVDTPRGGSVKVAGIELVWYEFVFYGPLVQTVTLFYRIVPLMVVQMAHSRGKGTSNVKMAMVGLFLPSTVSEIHVSVVHNKNGYQE